MIEALEVEGTTVLFLAGELDAVSSVHVRDTVAGLLADGRRHLVLDLSGVQRIYAAGLTLLLDLHRAARAYDARLVCCGARPFVREVLRITRLNLALDLELDLDSALDLLTAAS